MWMWTHSLDILPDISIYINKYILSFEINNTHIKNLIKREEYEENIFNIRVFNFID